MTDLLGTWWKCVIIAVGLSLAWSGAGHAAERLEVAVDKTIILDLERAASVVAIANPAIADVNVQSPTSVIVTGKAPGATSLNIFDAQNKRIAGFEVVVGLDDSHVTINHGVDAVKTLNCQPRCVRVSNPAKEPEAGASGPGAGMAGPLGEKSKTGRK